MRAINLYEFLEKPIKQLLLHARTVITKSNRVNFSTFKSGSLEDDADCCILVTEEILSFLLNANGE